MLDRLYALYPLFILAGVIIGGVLLILRQLAREQNKVALDLIRLNESLGFDIFAFLDAGARRLIDAGFLGITWELDWFGSTSLGERWKSAQSRPSGIAWKREVIAPDIAIRFRLYPGQLAGERLFLAEHLCETLVLLLKTDAWIKAGGVASALSEFNRMTLLLGHDVKNLAQFIRIASDQIENLPEEGEKRYLEQLRYSLPLFRERSEHIILALTQSHTASGEPVDIALAAVIRRLASAQGLMAQIAGEATVRFSPSALDSILDNLLRNHAEHAQKSPLHIEILPGDDGVRTVITSGTVSRDDFLHLFEPFWTNSPTGLGLGLYQSRQLAREHGGNLFADMVEGNTLRFELRLPAALAIAPVKLLDSPTMS